MMIRRARRGRAGAAGIVAAVILFAMLFTVGGSYFLFVNSMNNQYTKNLVNASNKLQASSSENLVVSTLLLSNGDVGFYANNTSGVNVNMTLVYVLSSSGGMLKCDGVGLPGSAGCSNTTPALWAVVNAGKGSPATGTYDTGYLYAASTTDTVKVITQRGNTFAQTYPMPQLGQAAQSSTSQALQINLATYKWVQLLPQATSVSQTGFTANCNSASCGKAFGSSVAAADTLVYALGWYNHTPPATPTDTLSDTFSLAASASVTSTAVTPVLVQSAYAANCNSASCAKGFSSNVASGDILVYGLGWYANSPPSTPTDTLGDSYSLAASKSASWSGSPALVQSGFAACGATSCSKQFSSAVTPNDVLVAALGWNNHSPPSSVTDTLGNTFTLQTSVALGSTPSVSQTQSEVYCNNTTSCQTGKIPGVPAGDIVVAAVGWATSAAPTISDSQGDSFTLGASNSVTVSSVTYYSYVYYATAATTADEKITATFGGNTNIDLTGYDVSGAATQGTQSSTGSSSSGVTSGSVTSFTPTAGSVVIAQIQTSGAANFNDGSNPYSVPGGPVPCNAAPGKACSIDGTISSGSTTAPLTWGSSVGYTEAALSLPPQTNTVNAYIYTATNTGSGTDTITASFSSSITNGGISIYEISGATTTGAQTSTGSQNGGMGSSSATVTSFTPASDSFVIGQTDAGPSQSPGFGHGPGYTNIAGGGTCNPTLTCGEYASGIGSAQTVQENLGGGGNINVWAEAALSLPPASVTYYSYIWYATAGSSGADTITASFSTATVGSISIYEVSGAVTSGLLTSTGSSTSASSTATVTSYSVSTNSIIINNVETSGGNSPTAGSGYTLSGSCTSVFGCGEYETGVSGSHSGTMNLGPSSAFAEVSVDFAPATWTFYSYIWTATAATAGSDTITASFSGTVAGSVSIYDLTGVNPAAILSSTGSSSSQSSSLSVSSITPYLKSIVIGAAEAGAAPTYSAGAGFSLVGTCSAVYGCSESQTNVNSATTVPMTLNNAEPWVESAISIGAQINPQSGYLVGGYPSMGVPDQNNIAWHANFTNTDPGHRAVTLWPQSEISINGIKTGGPKHNDYFIIGGVNQGVTGVNAYPSTPSSFTTVAYGSTVQLWFAANAPLSATYSTIDFDQSTPYTALFSLTGVFSDGTLYGETIPYPTGEINQADAQESVSAGATGTQVTVSCTTCGYRQSGYAMIGWIDHSGKMTVLTTFTTTSGGGIPSNTKFTVPSAPAGYYTIMVSDYVNTVFMTFQHS